MRERHVNLYSDTQSRPSRGMRLSMLDAEVGDEQLGSIRRSTASGAKLCDQISVMIHCRPGDETLRAVTHLDVGNDEIEKAGRALADVLSGYR